ncbi:hypothetical protein HYY69_05770 [Candidatus Woesearchaeota archaeon]|nr:hypothetical protein [Candidatus Woesearchaeota archaeon]
MSKLIEIKQKVKDPTVNIILDTLERNKQALVFVNSKRSAEKVAEEIAGKTKITSQHLTLLSETALHALSKPTSQCERLARIIKNGVAFHHSGLLAEQRELIEDSFRNGTLKVICCTPTLSWGVDLPAFRCIIRDLKRYTQRGLLYIPTLDYHQIAGRAGRPGKEDYGEAICIVKDNAEKEIVLEKFIWGDPEEIYSKLAVEPVLRTYLLSLIATEFVKTKQQIMSFFLKTFWAHQFEDHFRLEEIIDKVLDLLENYEFIVSDKKGFKSANELDTTYEATTIGKRVAELYLDPLTAYEITICLQRAQEKRAHEFSFLHMISHALEMRPWLKVKSKEYENIQVKVSEYEDHLLVLEPNIYDYDYDRFLESIKTGLLLQDWIEENTEEQLLEKYDVRPGELRAKLDRGDWLLYATEELCKLLKLKNIHTIITKTRIRLQYGVKEELLRLLKLKGIGRVRARTLYNNGIKDLGDIKKIDVTTLSQLIGKKVALDIKEQVGEKLRPEDVQIKENKRKGQISLLDY